MSWPTLLGLFLVTGGSTTIGSLPVLFHHFMKHSHWSWWESFGGGVMVSASIFSLFIPAFEMTSKNNGPYSSIFLAWFWEYFSFS